MRQYIGARYVPKFDGTWVNNKTYEALTVVDYLGDSYTSKKPVPVNTPPTDTDYWALTGAYNSQISNLATRVTDLENSLNGEIYIFKSSFDTATVDGLGAYKNIQTPEFLATGITPENSQILGWSAYNHVSDSWWSNDEYPGKYEKIKTGTVNLSVTSLAAGATTDRQLGPLANLKILGYSANWNTTTVLNVELVNKGNDTVVNITNTYTSAITDTGVLTYYYIDPADTAINPAWLPCIVPKIVLDNNDVPYLFVQSSLASQYGVGDDFRVVVFKGNNVINA